MARTIFIVFISSVTLYIFYFYICTCTHYKENKSLHNNVADNLIIVLVEIWKSLSIFWPGICGNVGQCPLWGCGQSVALIELLFHV